MRKLVLIAFTWAMGEVRPSWGDTPFLGVSAYAAMSERYPCQRLMRATYHSRKPAIAVLWRSFGESTACMEWFMDLNRHRPHLLQIHITNEVCRRNRRCFEGEFLPRVSVGSYNKLLSSRDPRTLQLLRERVSGIVEFINHASNPNTVVILSTGLEDNYSILVGDTINNDAYFAVLDAVRAEWSGLVSRNPEKDWYYPGTEEPAELQEVHDDWSASFPNTIANEDAVSANREDSLRFLEHYKDSFAIFLWRAAQQGAGQRRWRPPREREYRFPIREEIEFSNLLKEYSHVR